MMKAHHGLKLRLNTNNMDSVKVKSESITCRRRKIERECGEGRIYVLPHHFT